MQGEEAVKTQTLHVTEEGACAFEVGMTINVGTTEVMEIKSIDRQKGILYLSEWTRPGWLRRQWRRFLRWGRWY